MKTYLDNYEQVKKLTPKRAVRAYCAWCMNGGHEFPGIKAHTSKGIRECTGDLVPCDLYPYRLYQPGTAGLAKAIKRHCLDCRDTHRLVAACPDQGCPLHQYRSTAARKERRAAKGKKPQQSADPTPVKPWDTGVASAGASG